MQKRSESYIPKSVRENDGRFCQCALLKCNNTGCNMCTSTVTNQIKESVATGKIVQRWGFKVNLILWRGQGNEKYGNKKG